MAKKVVVAKKPKTSGTDDAKDKTRIVQINSFFITSLLLWIRTVFGRLRVATIRNVCCIIPEMTCEFNGGDATIEPRGPGVYYSFLPCFRTKAKNPRALGIVSPDR